MIKSWAEQWFITFSPPKTQAMILTRKNNKWPHPPVQFEGHDLVETTYHKHLGVTLESDLLWKRHINEIYEKSSKRVDILSYLKYKLDRATLETMYFSFIRPTLEYASVVWMNCNKTESDLLESVQKRAARIVSGAIIRTPSDIIYEELCWPRLYKRREYSALCLFHKMVNKKAPDYLNDLVPIRIEERTNYTYALRNRNQLSSDKVTTATTNQSFIPTAARLWNNLDPQIRSITEYSTFKTSLKKIYFPPKPNILFYEGKRKLSLIISRLRMNCSDLKAHLFDLNIIENAQCQCGYPREDTIHYFTVCPRYYQPRAILRQCVINLTDFTVRHLLHGDERLDKNANLEIYKATLKYIENSGRFQ